MKNSLLIACLSTLVGSWNIGLFAQNGTQKITVSDIAKVKQITSVIASPDGKKAVYTLKTIEPNADNKLEYDYRTHLYLVDFQTNKTPFALTRGSESISSPASNTLAKMSNMSSCQAARTN